MNPARSSRRDGAFTLIEMLMVIAIIGILFALLMPALARTKGRAKRIECIGNLRETGVAFQLFAHDHNGKFPAQVSTNEGGSLEFTARGYRIGGTFYFAFQHFRPIARELVTPKLLACPADLQRWPATNFVQFNNSNLSYFIGVKADPAIPDSILSGDANISGDSTIVTVGPIQTARWLSGPHGSRGNLLFSDAHVEESSDARFRSQISASQDIVLPSIGEAGGGGAPISTSSSSGNTASASGITAPSPTPPASAPNPAPQNLARASSSPPTNGSAPGQSFAKLSSAESQSMPQRSITVRQTATGFAPAEKPATIGKTPTPNVGPNVLPDTPNNPPIAQEFAAAMHESWDAAGWLLWLLLLLLLLIVMIRLMSRRSRRKRSEET
jgi:prepilin-type N-terminal cleavage/methylation domain-containing protein/prepilin-type processing-associated H-X9-DG protein